ncbi:MAG: DUF4255 domain-containing protein [Pseudomonadota bacterium]
MCEHIRDFVAMGIAAQANGVDISIGAPAAIGTPTEHHLNLFFYRFEPSGFEAGAQPDQPWNIRMFCMITPFGIDETVGQTTIAAGENDMRLLGDVMRLFHQAPILPPVDAGGVTVRPQVMFMSTTDEQINQIWSTQGEAHYRPSIVYEMSLTPIIPQPIGPDPVIVGEIGLETRVGDDRFAPFEGRIMGPPVRALTIDLRDPGWPPATAFVLDDTLHRALAIDVEDPAFAGFVPAIWLAGDPNSSVDLVWEVWTPGGFVATGAPIAATPRGVALDPLAIPTGPGFPLPVPLPQALPPGEASLQFMLFAERRFTPGPGAPEAVARSEPLLLTLWRTLP